MPTATRRGPILGNTSSKMPAGERAVAVQRRGDADEDCPGGLPKELLVKVLEQVPQKFRLRGCSLACSTWRDAAAAASSKVQLGGFSPISSAKVDSLVRWLGKCGQHVSSLYLAKAGTAATPFHPGLLPCTQLQHLTLSKCHLQLTGQSLSRLTSLTRLDLGSSVDSGSSTRMANLSSNNFDDFPDCLLALTQLTGLQHLHITATPFTGLERVMMQAEGFPPAYPCLPVGVVSHLVHLTHLDISGFAVTGRTMAHIARLSDLQHLDFGNIDSDDEDAGDWLDEEEADVACILPANTLAALSGLHHLTSLRVPGAPRVVGSDSTPGFSTLTALRSLELSHSAGLQSPVLSNMTALQALKLWGAPLRPALHGMQALLGVLPRLQQHTELYLFDAMCDAAPAAQYSALVSSSKLEKLMLTGSLLPQEARCAMFDGRRQLPALRSVIMNGWVRNLGCSLRTQELRSLALSCPGLQELTVHGSLDPAADFSVLQLLQQLGHLIISNVSDSTAVSLAQLTSLQLLQALAPNSITDAGMAHLTALRQLNTLDIYGSPDGFSNTMYSFMSTVPSSSGAPPNVWQQLQQYLSCPPAARQAQVNDSWEQFQGMIASILSRG